MRVISNDINGDGSPDFVGPRHPTARKPIAPIHHDGTGKFLRPQGPSRGRLIAALDPPAFYLHDPSIGEANEDILLTNGDMME